MCLLGRCSADGMFAELRAERCTFENFMIGSWQARLMSHSGSLVDGESISSQRSRCSGSFSYPWLRGSHRMGSFSRHSYSLLTSA